MRVAAAILCDFAQVREGLLVVASGGITRLWRQQLPAPLGVSLALLVEVPAADRRFPHEVRVDVLGPDGASVAQARGGLQIAPGADTFFDSDEAALVPLALDLHGAAVQQYGWHSIAISIDSEVQAPLRFKVATPPTPPSAPVSMPGVRPSRPH